MKDRFPPPDPEVLALRAISFLVAEPELAARFLTLTGLEPAELRARLAEPGTLASALAFLEAHEPDLIVCANALAVEPQALVAARITLEGDSG